MSTKNECAETEIISSSETTTNIVTQLSDMSDSIITSLSNSELGAGNIITPHGSIIITNEGIVFPPGTLMISQPENENLRENTSLSESLNDENVNDNNEFDIKVESNALKTNSLTSYKVESNQTDDENDNTSFSMHQNVLQNISDSDTDLQHITFSNGDHITQFNISMSDFQNLQKVNRNVFMSQAALPEDCKGLEVGENIIIERSNKHTFLTAASSLDNCDNKTVLVQDDTKQYLNSDGNFSSEDSGPLFIKPEGNNASDTVVIQTDGLNSNNVKSEVSLASVNQQSNDISSNNTTYQQIMYVHVDNGTQTLIPVSATDNIVHNNLPDPKSKELGLVELVKKKKSRKSRAIKPGHILPKDMEQPEKIALRTLAPRLLSYPLYAGAQAGLGIGKSLLRPFNLASMQVFEGGQYFEVLGRCTQCFRFSRTTSYCRAEKNHREPKSSVCLECEVVGLSTVVCRRKLNHAAPNAQPLNVVINTALQQTDHVKQLCVRNNLPPCFAELNSIVIHHADITFVAQKNRENEFGNTDILAPPLSRKPTDYGRGYLYPYSKEKWEQWLVKFCHQTSTNYRIRTGKRVNKKADHGLANHNGKIVSYRTLETQLYNCALGGKPRKRKAKDGIKKRKERGSKLIGCPAVIHTRLVETEYEWCTLEITVPKVLAHLPFHDPRTATNTDILLGYNNLLLSQINPTQMQQPNHNINNEQRFDFVPLANEVNEDLARKKDTLPNDVKTKTKNIFLNCANLVDMIENTELITAVHEHAQVLLNKLVKETTAKPPAFKKPKRKKQFNELDNNETLDIDEVTSDHVTNDHVTSGVSFEQIEKIGINILTNIT